jgi:protein-S-isoprenylcysteine O-methyltransferase Ste14
MSEGVARSDGNTQATPGFWVRGGGWVAAQFPLIGLALVAARIGPALPGPVRRLARWVGIPLFGLGGLLFLLGAGQLGRNLTPFPMPKSDSTLIRDGVYGYVRHPIYGGGVLGVLGWALLNGRWAGLLAAMLVGIFFDIKATHEERWLTTRFPEYGAYRHQVHKLVPFIY